ncbi:MAG: hypothetical protein DWB99_07750 [Candidatus Poseidoniales archaeon]|nr:MAG: hypothetical protein DWB99_07750 [Candidatus Poseidoniales archaeon]
MGVGITLSSVVLLDCWRDSLNMAAGKECISELDLPDSVKDFITDKWGITKLHPPQFEAMPSIFKGRNVLLAIPTASGKSLVAYIAILRKLMVEEIGTKAIYIVPLKALASEKFEDLKEISKSLNLTVGLGIGDSSSEAKKIDECDILVCTSEKLDSIIRNKPQTMSRVSIVVADEFHLMNDSTRGPTLEINLTKLRFLRKEAQLIALSATVGNCQDLANWLDADLIQSDWRPVALEYSTFHDLHLEPRLVQSSEVSNSPDVLNPPRDLDGPKTQPTWVVLKDTIMQKGQLLIFVGTRRSAESEALKLSKRVSKLLEKEDQDRLNLLKEFAESLEGRTQTAMGEKLYECIKGGIAFHHAGLTHSQRKSIESAFKKGLLIALTATPTLAAGVNLPARRVLVRDVKRWGDGMSRPLPVMEVRQMLGRAGRPKYDDYGEAWILCKGTDGWEIADDVSERYFFGEIESISSKLASEPALRTHLLSIISTGGLQHRGDIGDFFESTFLGFSISKNILNERIDEMLNWLVDERFIRRLGVDESYANKRADEKINDAEDWDDNMPVWANIAHSTIGVEFQPTGENKPNKIFNSAFGEPSFGFKKATELSHVGAWQLDDKTEFSAMKYEATLMGERITQLYLDPLSASLLRVGLRRAVRREVRKSGEVTNFGLLHLIATTPDFSSLWAKNSDMDINSNLWLKTNSVENELLADSSYDEMLLGNIKSAWLIDKWNNEESMRSIEKSLDVSPGDLHHRVDLASWLLLASKEILIADDVFSQEHMSEISEIIKKVDILRQRTRHGCKEDLLTLVNIRNIGRSRARELANLGIRTPQQVISMSRSKKNELLKLRGWGPVLIGKIISEVEKIISRTKSHSKANSPIKKRDDDIPLFDEKESDD